MIYLYSSLLAVSLFFLAPTSAAAIPVDPVERAISQYVPYSATCPSTALVRPATGLSDAEQNFRTKRKAIADVALKSWLLKTNSGFGTGNLPTVS